MLLLVAATQFEMAALERRLGKAGGLMLKTVGMGVVEAATNLTHYLAGFGQDITMVLNFGLAGAYLGSGLNLLDIAVAECEYLADLGVCMDDRIIPYDESRFPVRTKFPMDVRLLAVAEGVLQAKDMAYAKGGFATVSSTSGTRQRGDSICRSWPVICENMEGAAVARVCQQFGLPLLEIRCISNLVVDRDAQTWELKEASSRCAAAVAEIIPALVQG